MRFLVSIIALNLPALSRAFAPAGRAFSRAPRAVLTSRSFGVDPSFFQDLPQHINSLQDAFTSFTLADAVDAVSDVGAALSAATAPLVDAASGEAAPVPVDDGGGWFGFLTGPITGLLQIIHTVFVAVGLQSNAWGISIVVLTLLIKIFTYPLNKAQLESTTKMQTLQPAIKDIQAKYQSNPEVMNQKIAEFYQVNEINPLAGCIPSLVQIPVFIGLYRAVLDLAKENKLNEPFLWLPNLEGPTYGADPTHGSDWLLKNWVNGAPSLGWDDTLAFLVLPVLLVVSQFVSMELMTPKSDDPAMQQSNLILKILPLMIGWFSLSVPAALCVYWFANNIITTASSLWIKSTIKVAPVVTGGGSAATPSTASPKATIFAPPREKPSGFGSPSPISSDGVRTITAVDAEIVDDDEDDEGNEEVETPSGTGMESPQKQKRGGKKKKKRKD